LEVLPAFDARVAHPVPGDVVRDKAKDPVNITFGERDVEVAQLRLLRRVSTVFACNDAYHSAVLRGDPPYVQWFVSHKNGYRRFTTIACDTRPMGPCMSCTTDSTNPMPYSCAVAFVSRQIHSPSGMRCRCSEISALMKPTCSSGRMWPSA